jgi:adenine deaminase
MSLRSNNIATHAMSKKIVIVIALVATVIVNALPIAAQRNRGRRMIRVDLLVLNGTLVTMDKAHTIIQDAGIAVEGGRIVAVGPSKDILGMYSSPQRVNAAGKIIIPGLINGHTHG